MGNGIAGTLNRDAGYWRLMDHINLTTVLGAAGTRA